MPTVREIVDPNGTLPQVELRPVNVMDVEYFLREEVQIVSSGEVVGKCKIVSETYPDCPHLAHFDLIEAQKGHGFGMATYVLAIEQAHARGLPFETQDWDQTADSKRIWEKLAALGVAQIIKPFVPSPTKPGRYVGKFRVPPLRDNV